MKIYQIIQVIKNWINTPINEENDTFLHCIALFLLLILIFLGTCFIAPEVLTLQ